MHKRLIALTLVAALWCAQLAAAAPQAITRDDQKDLMVTIYNGNLGLVKDTRETRLDAGMLEVQFADVAAQIDPTSVHLKSLTDPANYLGAAPAMVDHMLTRHADAKKA